LEFVLEMLENKAFHKNLVAFLDSKPHRGSSSTSTSSSIDDEDDEKDEEDDDRSNALAAVQHSFLELADSLLQLLAFASATAAGTGEDTHKTTWGTTRERLSVRIEGSILRISPFAIGRSVVSWCYEAVEDIQRLVDAPSFVTILQVKYIFDYIPDIPTRTPYIPYIPSQTHDIFTLFCLILHIPPHLCLLSVPNLPFYSYFFVSNHPSHSQSYGRYKTGEVSQWDH
jgi:hypothetical protein